MADRALELLDQLRGLVGEMDASLSEELLSVTRLMKELNGMVGELEVKVRELEGRVYDLERQ